MKFIKKYYKKIFIIGVLSFALVSIIYFYVKSSTKDFIYVNANEIPKHEVGIIFGAGIKGNEPSSYLKDRLDAGILLFKTNKIDKILLSGDNGRDEYDELTVMKRYCYENGIDTTKIFVDYAGFDTYSTMYRAREIFKVDQAILITQEYHLNRAIYLGNQLGVKSIGFSANKMLYGNYNYVRFREFFSIFKSFLDVKRNRKPRFLGTTININEHSNFSKEDKR
jgi:SanA protein